MNSNTSSIAVLQKSSYLNMRIDRLEIMSTFTGFTGVMLTRVGQAVQFWVLGRFLTDHEHVFLTVYMLGEY